MACDAAEGTVDSATNRDGRSESCRDEGSSSARSRLRMGVRISRSLRWFTYVACVCAASGTLIYCYPRSLGRVHPVMVLLHDVSGDVAALLLGVYLWSHLPRTWPMLRVRPVSWWTGLLGGVAWLVAASTGVYCQVYPLKGAAALWWTHALASLAAVVLVLFHAGYGFRAAVLNTREAI